MYNHFRNSKFKTATASKNHQTFKELTDGDFTTRNQKCRNITSKSGNIGRLCVNRYGLIGEWDIVAQRPSLQMIEFWLSFEPKWDNIPSQGLNFIQLVSRNMQIKEKKSGYTLGQPGKEAKKDSKKLQMMDPSTGYTIDTVHWINNPLFNDQLSQNVTSEIKYKNDAKKQHLTKNSQILEDNITLLQSMSNSGNYAFRGDEDIPSINLIDSPNLSGAALNDANGVTANGYKGLDFLDIKFETYVVGIDQSNMMDGFVYCGLKWGVFYSDISKTYGKYYLRTLKNYASPSLLTVVKNLNNSEHTNYQIPEILVY